MGLTASCSVSTIRKFLELTVRNTRPIVLHETDKALADLEELQPGVTFITGMNWFRNRPMQRASGNSQA